jgi:hypothetical protein
LSKDPTQQAELGTDSFICRLSVFVKGCNVIFRFLIVQVFLNPLGIVFNGSSKGLGKIYKMLDRSLLKICKNVVCSSEVALEKPFMFRKRIWGKTATIPGSIAELK